MNDFDDKDENIVDNQICLISHTISIKWCSNITIIACNEFKFFVIAMIDSRSDMNYIQ